MRVLRAVESVSDASKSLQVVWENIQVDKIVGMTLIPLISGESPLMDWK